MEPKGNKVEVGSGSKRNRKGSSIGTSKSKYLGNEYVGGCKPKFPKFIPKFMPWGSITSSLTKFLVKALNEFWGTPDCDHSEFQAMKERPPYRYICHTLCERWSFCYGSLLTRYLRALEVEEKVHDVFPHFTPHLVCHLVDVTKIKAQDVSHGPVLSTIDRQAPDDSWMGQMYRMAEL
ncbi:hypothetical protein H5410_026876 [Solanum commersonii]|uniref:Uncharacterized protein n=1 Tax=Solanum commersonii TaxID=4109 RepID=A0A9J5Z057_SOLCO|nr:hypothetical protein H5410_026876 [Solanum commersonii]